MLLVPAPGHPDVGGLRGRVIPQQEMPGVGGVALGAVDGGGVGQLHPIRDIAGGQDPVAAPAFHGEAAVGVDGGDGPGVPVRHSQGGVVAAGRDPIPHPDRLAAPRGDHGPVIDPAQADQLCWMAALSSPTCWRVSAATTTSRPEDDSCGRVFRESGCAVVIVRVQPHVSAGGQGVEHPAGVGAGPHRQAQVGVVGVGEPVNCVEGDPGLGCGPAGGDVQDPAAADRR